MFFLIFSIVVIVNAILLFMPIKLKVSYLLYKGENRLTVRAGVISAFLIVHDSQKKEDVDLVKITDEAKEKKEEKQKIDFGHIKQLLNSIFDAFGYLRKRLIIEELKLHFHIGTGDAACTGILTGSAWGFLYNFVSLCDNKFILKHHDVKVCPNFEREVFETDIQGKISLKNIYAFVTLIKVMKAMKILKGMKK